MKYIYIIILTLLFTSFRSESQILKVNQIIQEQNQWCWAGVSACILDYYSKPAEQCEIAEYARKVITWYDFGKVNCCQDPTQGCNYWNYNYGPKGSIQDILRTFANIDNTGIGNYLSLQSSIAQLEQKRPFIIRWGWKSGGGHFVVGYGISGSNLYYMNPWPGEGKKIADYSWVISSDQHDWTHTNILLVSGTDVKQNPNNNSDFEIFPNPVNDVLNIKDLNQISEKNYRILNVMGEVILEGSIDKNNQINTSNLVNGLYYLYINNKLYTEKNHINKIFIKY